ncbi:MAG: hypothetical protein ACNA8W_07105 [Bradymonadaceae bacterium]
MKKIKKRSRDRSLEWHIFIVEAPGEIDPVGLSTLLLVMNPTRGEFADFLPLPRPLEPGDVVEAVETLYRHLPLSERPAKITVMAKKYVEPLASSTILSSAKIVGDRNPEFEKEILQFLKKMPEKLSEGIALGIEPRRDDFLALARRIYQTRAWLHLFDEEVLILDVPGKPLSHPRRLPDGPDGSASGGCLLSLQGGLRKFHRARRGGSSQCRGARPAPL